MENNPLDELEEPEEHIKDVSICTRFLPESVKTLYIKVF
jgi:hypothetical protein